MIFLLFTFFKEKYFKIVTPTYSVESLRLNMQEASYPAPRLLPVKRNVLAHPAERCRSPWEVWGSHSKFLAATPRDTREGWLGEPSGTSGSQH